MTGSESVTTLSRLFLHICRTHPKPELLKAKADGVWRALSTSEFEQKVRRLTLGLRALGLRPGDKVGLLAESGPHWIVADFAILCAGGVTVPIFPTLPADHVRYILDDSEASFVLSAGGVLWEKIAAVRPQLRGLKKTVLLTGGSAEKGLTIDDVIAMGAKAEADDPGAFERNALAVAADDLASIIYTSGTTGQPKGVMLTHGNFVSNILALASVVPYDETDVVLSFLPLSHVLERTGSFLHLNGGCSIVFAESVASVAENLLEIRPTKMISVPRLFEKIYARILDQVLAGSAIKKAIFFWAVRTGKRAVAIDATGRPLPKGLAMRRRLARLLVFDKILARTGGRVRFFISGGAALAPDITEFFDALGLIILPGYGLTETSPVLTGNTLRDRRLGTVGKAIPGVVLRIAEDGEILARGPNIMRGYYKDEEATRTVMDGGWFHTGDLGRLDEDGFLTITGRKKDVIVTSGGKNVVPQPIESLILANPYIQNVVVVGAERKFIAALVVPDFVRLEAYARSHGIDFRDREELCRREEIISFLMAEIDRATSDLAPFEKIKKIAVLDRDFEIEAGEMTPTLKIKRNIVERKYKAVIDSLYGEGTPL
jgi:long-chain acyl-CoA synthetase